MITVPKCPSCGGTDLYRSAESTPASGILGPDLLPKLSRGRFRVVVCHSCGLMSLFASLVNTQGLRSPDWERISEVGPNHPLGLV